MKSIFNIVILLIITISSLSAQSYSNKNANRRDPLRVFVDSSNNEKGISVELDEGIEENYYKHMMYNAQRPKTIGYRIRIFSGSGHSAKKNAAEIRAKFISKYPDIGAYLQYNTPDYKVYVGDCRTKSEVLKLYKQIKKDFPYSFIPPKQEINSEKYKNQLNNERRD